MQVRPTGIPGQRIRHPNHPHRIVAVLSGSATVTFTSSNPVILTPLEFACDSCAISQAHLRSSAKWPGGPSAILPPCPTTRTPTTRPPTTRPPTTRPQLQGPRLQGPRSRQLDPDFQGLRGRNRRLHRLPHCPARPPRHRYRLRLPVGRPLRNLERSGSRRNQRPRAKAFVARLTDACRLQTGIFENSEPEPSKVP